jgi:hypothetical protein
MRRIVLSFALTIALAFLVALSAVPASAATSSAQHPIFHNMSHPVAVSYPCPGEPLSGVGSFKTGNGVQLNHCSSKHGIGPFGNNPSGQCINGKAYLQWNNTTYYAKDPGGNVGGLVQYWWCPTPSDPTNGINWSYGEEYPLSGCGNFDTGSGWGANIEATNGVIENDGEGYKNWTNVCTYIWDYSQPGWGGYHWIAWMWAHNTLTGGVCKPETPGYL